MNKINCYINDDYIDVKKANKYIHLNLKCIKDNNVVDSNCFIKELRKTKLFSGLISNNVIVYFNRKINEIDEYFYQSIFYELNCNKVTLLDTSKKLQSPTLIANKKYILFYNNNYYFFEQEMLNTYLEYYNIDKLRIISKTKIKHNNKCKYFYYNNQNIL